MRRKGQRPDAIVTRPQLSGERVGGLRHEHPLTDASPALIVVAPPRPEQKRGGYRVDRHNQEPHEDNLRPHMVRVVPIELQENEAQRNPDTEPNPMDISTSRLFANVAGSTRRRRT